MNCFELAFAIGLSCEFIKNGGVKVTYKNGAQVQLTKYFAMATRTARTETQNLVVLDDAKRLGTDYVYLAPCTSPCKTCAALGNRVYCISGKDKSYPSVYGVLFKNGYTCIHPHCRCVLRPFFIQDHSKEEMQKLQEDSNRSLDLDPRTEQQRQAYQDSQAFNHRVWDAQTKYTKAKEILGKKLPTQLNTKPKFQTAHAKQTPRYKETMQEVRFIEKRNELEQVLTKLAIDGKIPIQGSNFFVKKDTEHALARLIQRNVSNAKLEEALISKPLLIKPVKYNDKNQPSHEIIYEKITICINPLNGNITTVYPTHSKLAKKLKGENNGRKGD